MTAESKETTVEKRLEKTDIQGVVKQIKQTIALESKKRLLRAVSKLRHLVSVEALKALSTELKFDFIAHILDNLNNSKPFSVSSLEQPEVLVSWLLLLFLFDSKKYGLGCLLLDVLVKLESPFKHIFYFYYDVFNTITGNVNIHLNLLNHLRTAVLSIDYDSQVFFC
jgi:hypothetical protein